MSKRLSIILLVLLSCFLRIPDLGKRSMYTDENFTLLNANGIWPGGGNQTAFISKEYFTAQDFWQDKGIRDYFEAVAHSDFGTHIVYNAILHVWMQVFGNHDFSVRLLSVFFNVIMILTVFLMVLRVFQSNKAAFLSSLLLVFDPFNIAQSQIARSYSLSFFLVVTATLVFVEIINGKVNHRKMALYAFLIGLSLLNHYLNFLVPLAHGIVFLFIRNKKILWPGFILAAILNICLMAYWFTSGGGHLAMGFLKDKNQKHLLMAQQGTNGSLIPLSTPVIVAKKAAELFFDSNIFTLKSFQTLNGLKPFFLSIALFLVFLLAYNYKQKRKFAFSVGLFLTGVLFLTIFKSQATVYLAMVFFYFVLYFLMGYLKQLYQQNAKSQFALLSICLLMLIIPIIFVVYDALKNGHATSMTKRYIGISAPFVAILIGIGTPLFIKKIPFSYGILLIIVLAQYKVVEKQILDYKNDASADLSAWFLPARVPNPNITLASKVQKLYEQGDTLVIPGAYKTIYDKKFGQELQKNFSDAQLLNLYLPKDSKMLQTVDAKEDNRVFLKKQNRRRIEIFNFENTKYRY